MKTLMVPAILDGYTPRKDKSMTLRFITQELTDDEKLNMMAYHQLFGWLMFKPNEFTIDDIPVQDAIKAEGKTPSQRLRSVLFIYWKQKGFEQQFNQWYEEYMENIIQQVKDRLENE